MVHGLSCSPACRIFLDHGLNPCLLHWQAESLPLSHQGSPQAYITPSVTAFQVFRYITFYTNCLIHPLSLFLPFIYEEPFQLGMILSTSKSRHTSFKKAFSDQFKIPLITFNKGCQKCDKHLNIQFIPNHRILSGLAFQEMNLYGIQSRYI